MSKWIFTVEHLTYEIPEYMRDGLIRYVEYKIEPSGFLRAILENNLVEAVVQADINNITNLPAYANYLYNHIPSICWGSPEKVNDWLKMKE